MTEDFEWKAVSDFVVVDENGIGHAIIPWEEGWEMIGGALRRHKPIKCTCTIECKKPCKGECGCEACRIAYGEFLSVER